MTFAILAIEDEPLNKCIFPPFSMPFKRDYLFLFRLFVKFIVMFIVVSIVTKILKTTKFMIREIFIFV